MISCTPEIFNEKIISLAYKITNQAQYKSLYGIPRGGTYIAIAFSQILHTPLVNKDEIDNKTLIVDDIIDSGTTRNRYPDNDFICLYGKNKKTSEDSQGIITYVGTTVNEFVEFFWEKEKNEGPAEDAILRIIQSIEEDPNRKGIIETPKRVINSFKELYAGYRQNPKDVFKVFDEEEQIGGLVYLKDIEFYSMCEHHMLPFYGSAFIAYIPDGPVIGVSKLARLLDVFSRRLQIQERIAEQVTNSLMKYLNPIGAACLIEAKHLCIACRGVQKQNSIMGYSSLKGVFLEESDKGIATRNELMALWSRK